MAKEATPSGRFVWYDLMTTDSGKALDFYVKLFGWTVKEFDMGPAGKYQMVYAGEKGLGGITPLNPGEGVPSHWIGYVTCGDVDEAARKAAETGGRVQVPPTDIPGVGRFAMVTDAEGAVFAPFKANREAPDEAQQPNPGEFVWVELYARDAAQAEKFYGNLFGWSFEHVEMPTGTYTLCKNGEREEGGIFKMSPEMSFPPMWLPYVAVPDADEASAKAKALGAQVVMPTMAIPGIGRFAVILDPTNAAVALFDRVGIDKPHGG